MEDRVGQFTRGEKFKYLPKEKERKDTGGKQCIFQHRKR